MITDQRYSRQQDLVPADRLAACKATVIGVGAIGLASRGIEREIATPFKVATDVCIGCGSCTYICPTGCIEMESNSKTPQLRSLKIGDRQASPCQNDYKCTSCPTEQEFLAGLKKAVRDFREV